MSRRPCLIALVALCGLSSGGCATITTGTTQAITIDSEPQQASCVLTREGLELGSVTTPRPLTIKRNASTVHVVCRKEGYEDGRVIMNSRYETASTGNVLLGGIIGAMVDASSGANTRYEQYVMVRLNPMSPADQATAASRPKVVEPPATAAAVSQAAAAPAGTGSLPSLPPVPAAGFNGEYRGNIDMPGVSNLHMVQIAFVDGRGTGTVNRPRCARSGSISVIATATGQAVGEAQLVTDTACTLRQAKVTGKADRSALVLTFDTELATSQPITFERR